MGYPFVIITGNPNYYHRFGFESVTKYNIRYDYMLENEEHNYFMICKLNECDLSKYAGIYEDPKIYAIDKEELLEFEKKFIKMDKKTPSSIQ